MTAAERGFLLLSSHLGDPERKTLTVSQLRTLADRMKNAEILEEDRDLDVHDLVRFGFGAEYARRIIGLLAQEDVLDYYLRKAEKNGCIPITRVSENYPLVVRKRLGLDSPGVLWARGDVTLLDTPTVSLVGSRELCDANEKFAEEVGRQAAIQGYTLVSGNARGADKTAQNACLKAGGSVISILADSLETYRVKERVLYLTESSFDEPFSSQRALSRNRVIHSLGLKTFVAQSALKTGGTWDGTVKNLRFGWSPVFCFDDKSEASRTLIQMGANPVKMEELGSFYDLRDASDNIFDR